MCGHWWVRAVQAGREPKWCSDRCKQRAYREKDTATAAWASEQARRDRMRGRLRWEDPPGWDSGAAWDWTSWRTSPPPPRQEEGMSVAAAREVLHTLAGVPDDGVTPLKRVFRLAFRAAHPHDHTGDDSDMRRVVEARDVLRHAGLL